jgi:hypothetical protein
MLFTLDLVFPTEYCCNLFHKYSVKCCSDSLRIYILLTCACIFYSIKSAFHNYEYCSLTWFYFQNPDYMKENFVIKIESMHLPDKGETENVSFCWMCCHSKLMLKDFHFMQSCTSDISYNRYETAKINR